MDAPAPAAALEPAAPLLQPAPAAEPAPAAQAAAAPVSGPTEAPVEQAAPATSDGAAPATSHGEDEHPLAATNSPWLAAEQKLDAAVLPSAFHTTMDQPSPVAVPEAVAETSGGGSRMVMTVGLGVAAVALIAAVAYFAMSSRDKSHDPTNVDMEQREYTEAADTATASAKPVELPEPVQPIKRPVKTQAPVKKPPEDIYEGL